MATQDWTKPQAMAIPKEGYFELQQGKYGPVYPKTPACYGFTIIAKIKPGREEVIRGYGKTIEGGDQRLPGHARAAEAALPALGTVRHRQRYLLHVSGHLRHRFRQVHRRRCRAFTKYGVNTVFENLEGFPEDWKTNVPGLHQVRSRSSVPQLPGIRGIPVRDARTRSRRRSG